MGLLISVLLKTSNESRIRNRIAAEDYLPEMSARLAKHYQLRDIDVIAGDVQSKFYLFLFSFLSKNFDYIYCVLKYKNDILR